MRFTARIEASKGNRSFILEDAPRATRIGYLKGILHNFVGTTDSYRRPRKEPLDISDTHTEFIALIRDEAEAWDYDNESAWGAISEHLKVCKWTEFYDFVELVGLLLINKEAESPFDEPDHFKNYQTKVNALFQEDGVGWSLNDKAELYRQVPKALSNRIKGTETLLTDNFDTARIHYQKALGYLHQHPIDEANSIKEIVSALESVARVLFPKAKTLGDAIKLLRKDQKYAPHFVDSLEKLYAYSNVTPLIRHGHSKVGSPKLAEAELALFMGTAFIRYLMELAKEDP